MSLPLNLVYRSRPIQYPLIAAMNACDAWERAGLDLQSVAYVAGADKSDPMLVRGECDFIFGSHISPYLHRFHGQPFVYLGQCVNWVNDVLVSREPLPMVQATTLTTLWPTLEGRRDLCEAVIKAVLMGVAFIKTQPEPMREVMERDVAAELQIEDPRVLRHLQTENQAILEPRLYPRPDAIANAFELAVMEEPAIRDALNPMSLWDIHLLRSVEESGYVDTLYDGQVPGPGAVHAP